MRSTPRRLVARLQQLLPVVLSLWAADAYGQAIRETARSQSESGLTLTVEAFCSETRLRTANVRVRWTLTPAARSASGLTSLAAAKQTLDTTVFNEGFEKGLYVSLPVPGATPPKPVPPVTQAALQARQTPLRAYQFQLIEVAQPRAVTGATAESGEVMAVIEDVEPGVNYTWRLTIETASGKLVSAPVSLAAPTCPADLIETATPPRRRP